MSTTSDQFSIYGRGNRGPAADALKGNSLITAWSTTFPGGNLIASWSGAIDGIYGSSNGPFYTAFTANSTHSVQWTFAEAIICSGFNFAGGDITALGTWQAWGSNNGGTTKTNLGTFVWSQVANGLTDAIYNNLAAGANRGCAARFTNSSAFTTYGMDYVSGTFNGGRLCNEIDFWISHSSFDGGDRTASMVVTCSQAEINGRAVSKLVDSDEDQSSLHVPMDLNFGTFPQNGFFQFDFGNTITAELKKTVVRDLQSVSYGTWQWSGSNNGSTFANSGASFTFDTTNMPSVVLPAVANGDTFRYWRLTKTDVTGVSLNQLYEFQFEIVESIPVIPPSPQPMIILIQ